jgi:hypothetical protein
VDFPKIVTSTTSFQIAKNMKPASAAMSVFIGLNASNEELKLEKENVWAFPSNEASTTFRVTFLLPFRKTNPVFVR